MVPAASNSPIHTVYDLAARFPDVHLLLPQRTYRPHTQSDRRRYVEEVDLEQPIMFYMQSPYAGREHMCWGGLQPSPASNMGILGDVFLKQFFAVFDGGNLRFGVAEKN